MNFRSPALLVAVRQLPCMLRLPGCTGGPSEASHSNQSRHGKGGALRAHDCFIAAGCKHCHHEVDNGNTLTREERIEVWQRAHDMTILELFRRGVLIVARVAKARVIWKPRRSSKTTASDKTLPRGF